MKKKKKKNLSTYTAKLISAYGHFMIIHMVYTWICVNISAAVNIRLQPLNGKAFLSHWADR